MAESSKTGNAAQALQRHLERDHSAHPGQQGSRMGGSPGAFRDGQHFAAQQHRADEQFAQEQMGRMNLDDLERSGSPAFLPGGHAMYAGRSTSPAFHSRGPAVHSGHQSFNPGPHGHYSHGGGASQQHVPGGMPTAANGPLLSVEEFMTRQGTLDTVVADPSNATLDMRTALPGHQFTGSPFAGQAYVPPHGNQSGFMPGYQGYSGALMSGRSLFNNQAQSAAAEVLPDQREVAVAWEDSFQEAMNDWILTQNNLDSEAALQAAENTDAAELAAAELAAAEFAAAELEAAQAATHKDNQDRPLNNSQLARAAQQLVDAVSDNDSEKFRNSSFVDLMRRIAAQQVVVENNSLVEANPTADETQAEARFTTQQKGKGKAVAYTATVEDGDST